MLSMRCNPVKLSIPGFVVSYLQFLFLLLSISDAYLFKMDSSKTLSMLERLLCGKWEQSFLLRDLCMKKISDLD